jgi:molybdenum cofactor cytidylyltransferase
MHIAALILAAGRSRRFGSDKRQARLPDGAGMLETVLSRYGDVFDSLWLVVGEHDALGPRLARAHGAHCVVNTRAHLGMGHSLACGAKALLSHPDIDGVVIGLADMPAVLPRTLWQLRQGLCEGATAVMPRDRAEPMRPGQPRGLARPWFADLSRCQGEQGARHLVDWQRAQVVEVDDPGVWLDVDTPGDLARLRTASDLLPPAS